MGVTIREDLFPRVRARRIPVLQDPDDAAAFEKRASENLDYSVDLSGYMEEGEVLLGCYAFSNLPAELVVTAAAFADKGMLAFVYGGKPDVSYLLKIVGKSNFGRVINYAARIEVTDTIADSNSDYAPPIVGTSLDGAQNYLTDAAGVFLAPTYTDASGRPLWVASGP